MPSSFSPFPDLGFVPHQSTGISLENSSDVNPFISGPEELTSFKEINSYYLFSLSCFTYFLMRLILPSSLPRSFPKERPTEQKSCLLFVICKHYVIFPKQWIHFLVVSPQTWLQSSLKNYLAIGRVGIT